MVSETAQMMISYRVGFTGTRHGMTPIQKDNIHLLLTAYYTTHGGAEFHHGDCVGADVEAAEMAQELKYTTHAHPGNDPSRRAFHASDVIYDPKPFLERNLDIVSSCDVLFATPDTDTEQLRSGTWSTIRKAEASSRFIEIAVILPDGSEWRRDGS